ncbi:hypothetical protein KFK09_026299 [Dendrobium nobile]|uniref:Uncharacterized protein n=1 Tax=Dendrobium nobile TaxID=94219 RepID=A0A8T3A7U3_DENNO|nr:hypothetical protein KFK09_026299 [Dendrobium nobile]
MRLSWWNVSVVVLEGSPGRIEWLVDSPNEASINESILSSIGLKSKTSFTSNSFVLCFFFTSTYSIFGIYFTNSLFWCSFFFRIFSSLQVELIRNVLNFFGRKIGPYCYLKIFLF